MDELIRSKMHDALDVEQPAGDMRSRILSSLPAREPRVGHVWMWSGEWVAGFIAVLLAIAVVVGLLYTRGVLGPIIPGRGLHRVSPPRLTSPEGIVVAPDGGVYVSDYVGGYVFQLESNGLLAIAGTGQGGDGGRALNSSLKTPSGIAADRDGNLYVVEQCRQRIRRIDRGGIISTYAGRGPSVCGGPFPANNFTGDSGPATSAGLSSPLGLAFDRSGALYVGDTGSAHVRRIDPSGTISSLDTSSLAVGISYPGYLAFDATGNLYVSDRSPFHGSGNCRIVRFSPSGDASVVAGTGTCGFGGDGGQATAAQLDDPNGIAFDSAGNLYFSDSNNHRIRRIDRNGVITTVAGTGVAGITGDNGPGTRAQLQSPFGLAVASGNLLYIAEVSCGCTTPVTAGRVRVLRLSDGIITTAAG